MQLLYFYYTLLRLIIKLEKGMIQAHRCIAWHPLSGLHFSGLSASFILYIIWFRFTIERAERRRFK